MVGKKKLAKVGMFLVMAAFLLTGCGKAPASVASEGASTDISAGAKKEKFSIGIMQIIEHPALDAARRGIIDGLTSRGFEEGKNIEIDFQNAQGEMATAQTIGKGFAAQKKDMILAIATPTAQAAFNATKEIPIVITAVTDPVEAGLVQSWEKTGTNVTGTSDGAPLDKQLQLLKKIIPHSKNDLSP